MFATPPAWQAQTAYRSGIDMVSAAGFYFLCLTTGISGTSVSFTLLIGTVATDNAGQKWVCCANARAAWQANHAYTAGAANTSASGYPWPDQLIEESGGALFECIVSGTSGGSQPSWPSSMFSIVTDGSVTWQASNVPFVYSAGQLGWVANYTYPLDEAIAENGCLWVAIVAGTTGATHPVWPPMQAQVQDGSAVWAFVSDGV